MWNRLDRNRRLGNEMKTLQRVNTEERIKIFANRVFRSEMLLQVILMIITKKKPIIHFFSCVTHEINFCYLYYLFRFLYFIGVNCFELDIVRVSMPLLDSAIKSSLMIIAECWSTYALILVSESKLLMNKFGLEINNQFSLSKIRPWSNNKH